MSFLCNLYKREETEQYRCEGSLEKYRVDFCFFTSEMTKKELILDLYTKLSTICTGKHHRCGIKNFVSSSNVCFGICDKSTKTGKKRAVFLDKPISEHGRLFT